MSQILALQSLKSESTPDVNWSAWSSNLHELVAQPVSE